MDLTTIETIRQPTSRADLALAPGEAFLAGGSWMFSELQTHLTGLVDLTTLRWPALTVTDEGLSIAATCTFAELAAMPAHTSWMSHPLFLQCCDALLGSFKVWNTATVGGNICLALAAGPMTSLASALDATAVIWAPDGGTRTQLVSEFVTGVQQTTLEPGELLRSIEIPRASLVARTAFRRIALSPLGRTGTLVIGRAEHEQLVITVSGGTEHPEVLRTSRDADSVRAAVERIDSWYDDAHGAPDWRRAMSIRFAEQIRQELDA